MDRMTDGPSHTNIIQWFLGPIEMENKGFSRAEDFNGCPRDSSHPIHPSLPSLAFDDIDLVLSKRHLTAACVRYEPELNPVEFRFSPEEVRVSHHLHFLFGDVFFHHERTRPDRLEFELFSFLQDGLIR